MKNNKTFLFTYILTLIGGVLLTFFNSHANIFDFIITIIGILFLIPSIFTIIGNILSIRLSKKSHYVLNWLALIPSFGGVIFGSILMIMPDVFKNYLIISFGFLLIVCGFIQLFNLLSGIQQLKTSLFYLIVPSLTFLCGTFILILGPDKIESIVTLATGIVLICYSINGLIGYYARRSILKKQHPSIPKTDVFNTKETEVDYNEFSNKNKQNELPGKGTYLSE